MKTLTDALAGACQAGQSLRALELLAALEELEPAEGHWPQRAAAVYRALDDRPSELAALMRAAERFESVGLPLRAVAAYRRMLELAPDHAAAREALSELSWHGGMPRGLTLAEGRACDAAAADEPAEDATLGELTILLTDLARSGPATGFAPDSGLREIALPHADAQDAEREEDCLAETRLDRLGHSPLLTSLPREALQRLISEADVVPAAENHDIFTEGDDGDALYVIVEGAVVVIADGPRRTMVAALAEGQFFGEAALLCRAPRNATARAVVDTTLLRISRPLLGSLVREYPESLVVLLSALSERMTHRLIRTSPVFEALTRVEQVKLAKQFRFLEAAPGTALIEQGARPRALFLVLSGHLRVVRTESGRERTLGELDPGDIFGEMALLDRVDSRASVIAMDKAWLLYVPDAEAHAMLDDARIRPRILAIAEARRAQNLASVEPETESDPALSAGTSRRAPPRQSRGRSVCDEVLRDLLLDRSLSLG